MLSIQPIRYGHWKNVILAISIIANHTNISARSIFRGLFRVRPNNDVKMLHSNFFVFLKRWLANYEFLQKLPIILFSDLDITVEKFKKIYLFSLCSPRLILTRSPQISGQNKSEARKLEGLVKITYGIAAGIASSFFKRAGICDM